MGRPKGSKNKKTGQAILKQASKTASAAPVTQEPVSLPLAPVVPKRGRPPKETDPRIIATFHKAMADAEKLDMTVPDFDGGGTKEDAPVVTKEGLQRRVTRRLNVLDRYLTDDKLIQLLAMSSLKEVGIYEGIMMDKSLVLQGQPNVIIGNDDRGALNNALPRVLAELKKRGMITTVRERSIEFQGNDSPSRPHE